jgi:hypothetical protein
MKKRLRLTFLLLFFFAGSSIYAQQNLFNIPSGDITPKGKAFYQHQFNVYSTNLESKGHFVYGLGKGWDAGLNLVGKGLYFTPGWRAAFNDNPQRGAVYPVLMGTLQKQFSLTGHLKFNMGAQAGFNLSSRLSNKELNYFLYALGSYHFGKQHGSKLVAGLYKGNRMFLGNGNPQGVMLGYEIKLSKRWYLMGDWMSGSNDASVAVIGGMYNVSKRVQFCAGYLLPNPHSPKQRGLVLEVNILGWNAYQDNEAHDQVMLF